MYIAYVDESGDDGSVIVSRCRQGPVGSQHGPGSKPRPARRSWAGSDLVGYGPHPNDVCALIAEREIPTIYGNYDYAIARDLDDCGCAYITQHDRDLGQQSVAWTLEHTDQASKDFMRELPFDLRFEVGSVSVHLGDHLAQPEAAAHRSGSLAPVGSPPPSWRASS